MEYMVDFISDCPLYIIILLWEGLTLSHGSSSVLVKLAELCQVMSEDVTSRDSVSHH
jgi:hypothetical protein